MQKNSMRELKHPALTSSLKKEPNRMLRITSHVMAIFAVLILCGVVYVLFEMTQWSEMDLTQLSEITGINYDTRAISTLATSYILISLLVSVLSFMAAKNGLKLLHSDSVNTYKEVANCQAIAIAIIGLSFITAVLNALILGDIYLLDLMPSILAVIPPTLYYQAVKRERRTGFWAGIKRPEIKAKEIPSLDQFDRSFAISSDDGMLYPEEDPQETDVDIMSLDEFLEVNGDGPIAQHIERIFGSAHHCSANTYGEYLYGAILIPVEEFDATDGAYDHDIAFVWLLTQNHIYFITDDAEDVLLLSKCFESQSLRKTSCAAVLYELISYIIHHDNNYLIDLESRLDHLEDNMSADVNEIPQDFSDYLAETRTDLCVIEGFYKQLADMAEDIETSPASILSKEARELYSSLDNKATRLASDTHMMREYVLQIRSIYQEKINIKQNNVMSVLTIVTSIFMPLTLVTGWYGMNFENMPELTQPYAYFIMIVIAAFIVTAEIVFFKKKRWF